MTPNDPSTFRPSGASATACCHPAEQRRRLFTVAVTNRHRQPHPCGMSHATRTGTSPQGELVHMLRFLVSLGIGSLLMLGTTLSGAAQSAGTLLGPDGTHGISPPDKLLVKNTKKLDLDTGLATVPIFRGTAGGTTVW